MFIEITDSKEIKRAQDEMSAKLKKQFPYAQERVVGWPSGHFSAQVRFAGKSGVETYWWYTGISNDKQSEYNLFGRGNPNDSKLLLIDLQFNFPVVIFNRKLGGVFVRDIGRGKTLLGHRGIVTRGKSRVPRELLLQEANITPLTITSDKSPNEVDVLLVAPIDDSDLGKQISEFAIEVRRAAYLVMGDTPSDTTSKSKTKTGKALPPAKSPLDVALNGYYDEFIGKTIISRAAQVTMNCRHGTVVKALRDELKSRGEQFKSVAMDLVVETDKEVFLYEVKTGSDSQSIYTGIGQLYFHAAALTRKFPGKNVVRHLVIPFAPAAANREKVCKELGIKIVTFNLSGQMVSITSGL
jgi:hypothetical protein